MRATKFIYAGTCKQCGKFFDWPTAYAVSKDGKWWGNGISIEEICRLCSKRVSK